MNGFTKSDVTIWLYYNNELTMSLHYIHTHYWEWFTTTCGILKWLLSHWRTYKYKGSSFELKGFLLRFRFSAKTKNFLFETFIFEHVQRRRTVAITTFINVSHPFPEIMVFFYSHISLFYTRKDINQNPRMKNTGQFKNH